MTSFLALWVPVCISVECLIPNLLLLLLFGHIGCSDSTPIPSELWVAQLVDRAARRCRTRVRAPVAEWDGKSDLTLMFFYLRLTGPILSDVASSFDQASTC